MAFVARQALTDTFSDDATVAAKAAYFLVSSSGTHGKDINPKADIDALDTEQAASFLSQLEAVLSSSQIAFRTSIKATGNRDTSSNVTVDVAVIVRRTLSFEVAGRKVYLGDRERIKLSPNDIEICCAVAAMIKSMRVELGSDTETVCQAFASFVIRESALDGSLPIRVVSPFLHDYRLIRLE